MGDIPPLGCLPLCSSRPLPPPPPRSAPPGAGFSSGLYFPGLPPPSGLRSSAHAEVGGWGSPRPATSARPRPPRSPAAAARRGLCLGPERRCRFYGLCWTTEALWRAVEAGAGLRAEAQSPLGEAVGVRGAGLGAAHQPRAFGGARKTPRAGCKTAAAGQERRGKGGKALEGGQRGLARAQRRAKPSRAGPCRGQRPSAGSRRAPASVSAPPPSRWLSAVHSSLGKTLNEPQMAGKRSKKPPGEGAGAARGVRPAAPKNRPGSQHRPGVRGSSRAHPKTSGLFTSPGGCRKGRKKSALGCFSPSASPAAFWGRPVGAGLRTAALPRSAPRGEHPAPSRAQKVGGKK